MARKSLPPTQQEKADAELAVFVEQSEARFQIAKRLYGYQDKETQFALDVMVDRIVSISHGMLAVKFNNGKDRVVVTIPPEAIRHNALYMATEIFKDLAMLEIRIASFTFDPNLCAVCNEPRKKSPAKKKKGAKK